ncbi:hypothetical protein GCM10027093_21810 [Paraburkholderia jirisanensis]
MPYTHTQFPGLTQQHIAAGARLFADRYAMVEALAPRGGVVTEVGVAAGDFSQFIIDTLHPSRFYALDTFDMHKNEFIWGRPSSELFGHRTQLEHFRARFAQHGAGVEARVGLSAELLGEFGDQTFDFIYIDAGHDYENVKRDAQMSARKLKRDGLIVFNDYTIIDVFSLEGYGVVQAVNELVVAGGWQVCAFALQHSMFCDIALRRT